MKVWHKIHSLRFPLFFAIVTLALTLIAWYFIQRSVNLRNQERFNHYAQEIRNEVISRMDTYVNALVQTKSMYHVTREVDRKEFHNYIQGLNILEEYPGVQGIAFTKKVMPEELNQHEKDLRSEGLKNFKVWPPGIRELYFSIVLIEPLDWRNQRALGYDMYSDPIRQTAMITAWKTGEPAMSHIVELVQETKVGKQKGFLIYVPLYNTPLAPLAESRLKNLQGFIYSAFRAKDLFDQTFQYIRQTLPVDVKIYLGDMHEDTLLYQISSIDKGTDKFRKTLKIEMAQNFFTVDVHSNAKFDYETSSLFPLLTLLLGFAVSVLIFVILWRYQLQTIKDKERASELEELYQKAQTAIKTRDEFLSVASHELKTPITSLKLQFQIAEKMIREQNPKAYEPKGVEQRVKKAIKQLDRMNSLIEDMLDTSRISLSKMPYHWEKVELNSLVIEVLDRFKEQFETLGIETHLKRGPDSLFVTADRYRLEQVLSNLISNAIKYGKGKPVTVCLKEMGKEAHILIEDQGLGIPADLLDKIFERYERATPSGNISGLGLGLYISKQIAIAHGGTIDVQSVLNQGSVFTLKLPLLGTVDL